MEGQSEFLIGAILVELPLEGWNLDDISSRVRVSANFDTKNAVQLLCLFPGSGVLYVYECWGSGHEASTQVGNDFGGGGARADRRVLRGDDWSKQAVGRHWLIAEMISHCSVVTKPKEKLLLIFKT
jgi:hypothetical protein